MSVYVEVSSRTKTGELIFIIYRGNHRMKACRMLLVVYHTVIFFPAST